MCSVTSQGHPYARFRRLLEQGRSLPLIRAAVAELPGPVPLDDALQLCLVLLELEPERFDAAAARKFFRIAGRGFPDVAALAFGDLGERALGQN